METGIKGLIGARLGVVLGLHRDNGNEDAGSKACAKSGSNSLQPALLTWAVLFSQGLKMTFIIIMVHYGM